jgi:ectoine hydroxylase-related dioxygenase (phytanoyl-CoA dioxygenase family)
MLQDNFQLEIINRLGFTKLQLIGALEIEKLRAVYSKFFGKQALSNNAMEVSHNNPNDDRALKIHKEIVEVLQKSFAENFENFEFLASHFVVKKAKNNQSFQIHQDWNVVDEENYYNYQVWIPLDLSYPENGGICFVPESHLFYKNLRSGSFGIPHIPISEKIEKHLSYLRLFPKEAAVFFSKTFHGSFMNSSNTDRVVVLVNIIQQKAKPIYFHKENEKLEVFQFGTESIFKNLSRLEKGSRALKQKVDFDKTINQYDLEKIDEQMLLNKILQRNKKNGLAAAYEHKLFSIIKQEGIEVKVNESGYEIIEFLSADVIKKLQDKFNEMFPNRDLYEGAYSGMNELSLDKRREMYQFIKDTITPSLDAHFKNYFLPITSFYSRKPDQKYLLEWHSDPSFIFNEHLESFYGIWCPLVDVFENTGTLRLVPKSHRLLNKLHFAYKTSQWALESKRALLDKYGKSFSLKAGQALLFDARMIHSSEPNYSNFHRDNIVMRINHEKSQYFSMQTESSKAEKGNIYLQDKAFFFTEEITKHNLKPKHAPKIGEMALFYNEIPDEVIRKKLED